MKILLPGDNKQSLVGFLLPGMDLTERQKEILNSAIEEFIISAKPVSSQLLEKKHKFKVCPATIRNEMQRLTDAGFVFQPHTSAGRVPTDKGYRFFVDELLGKDFFDKEVDLQIEKWIKGEIEDTVKCLQSITKNLASFSSNLAMGYLADEKVFWKEGWEKVFQEPEFQEKKLISDFFNLLSNFEEEIDEFEINSGIKVYIGKENPFSRAKDFSLILSKCHFPKREEGILAILGPKRMPYDKNIISLNSLTKLLEKF